MPVNLRLRKYVKLMKSIRHQFGELLDRRAEEHSTAVLRAASNTLLHLSVDLPEDIAWYICRKPRNFVMHVTTTVVISNFAEKGLDSESVRNWE